MQVTSNSYSSSVSGSSTSAPAGEEKFDAAAAFARVLERAFAYQKNAPKPGETQAIDRATADRAAERSAKPAADQSYDRRAEAEKPKDKPTEAQPREDASRRAERAQHKNEAKKSTSKPADDTSADDAAAQQAAQAQQTEQSQKADAPEKTKSGDAAASAEDQAAPAAEQHAAAEDEQAALLLSLLVPGQNALPLQIAPEGANAAQPDAAGGKALDPVAQALAQLQAVQQQLKGEAISPEAEKAALEAAKAALQNAKDKAGKGDAKAVSLETVNTDGAAPKGLVDPALLLAQLTGDAANDTLGNLPFDLKAEAQAMLNAQQADATLDFAGMLATQMNATPVAAQDEAQSANLMAGAVAAPVQPGEARSASAAPANAAQQARHLQAFLPPGEQVAVQVKRAAAEGLDSISIRLDPEKLGKVDVKLEVTHDGRLSAVISADRPETLQMLQKEAPSLEQSLRDAGLKTDSQDLSFTLRDQSQQGQQEGSGRGRGYGQAGQDDHDEGNISASEARLAAVQAASQRAAARGGLDIRI